MLAISPASLLSGMSDWSYLRDLTGAMLLRQARLVVTAVQAHSSNGALCNKLRFFLTPVHVLADVGDTASSSLVTIVGVADGWRRLLSRVAAAHSQGSLHDDEPRANVLLAFLTDKTMEKSLLLYVTL